MEKELVMRDNMQDIALELPLSSILSLSLSNKYLQSIIDSDDFWARWVTQNITPRHDADVVSEIRGPRPWRYYQQLHGKIGGDAIRQSRFHFVDLRGRKNTNITVALSVQLYRANPIFYIKDQKLFYVDADQPEGRPDTWYVKSAPRLANVKIPSLPRPDLARKESELVLLSEEGEVWILTINDSSIDMSEFNSYEDDMDYWVEMNVTTHAEEISPPFPGKAVDVALSSMLALALDQRGRLFTLDRSEDQREWKLLDEGPFLALEVAELKHEGDIETFAVLIDMDRKLSVHQITEVGIEESIPPGPPDDDITEGSGMRPQGVVHMFAKSQKDNRIDIVAVGDGYSRKNLFTLSFDWEKMTAKKQENTGVRRLITEGIISSVDGELSMGLGKNFHNLMSIQSRMGDVFVLQPITKYTYLTLSRQSS